MSSKISIPRNFYSSNNDILYKSLGALIKEYRQWRHISQEKLAESIKISVRQLQNWEANRRRARIENLHDLSEFTGIPMQVLVALNADQPIWYSLRKRLFTYSLTEKEQFSSLELFLPGEKIEDYTLLRKVTIATEKHIDMVLSCHRDLYGTENTLHKDIIKAAAKILPFVNIIIFDNWGHYMAHRVCLPISINMYQTLKKQKTIENYLTSEMITDIVTLGEGVFFGYSGFAANINAYRLILDGLQSLAKIKQIAKNIEGYMLANQTVTKDSAIIQDKLNMTFVRYYANLRDEVCPVLYETKLDYQLRPDGPFGWMLKPIIENALSNNKTENAQHKQSQTLFVQGSNKFSHPGKSSTPANISEKNNRAIVDKFVTIVDDKKRESQDDKTQCINLTMVACKNPKCTLYGKTEKGNIVSNGTYRTKQRMPGRRFLCKKCGKSFCHRTGTIFYDLRSPEEKVIKSLSLFLKGMPLQGVAESLGTTYSTVRRWLGIATRQSKKLDALLIKEYNVSPAELASLWTFVKTNSPRRRAFQSKAKNKSHSTTK